MPIAPRNLLASLRARFAGFYGGHPLHLLVVLTGFALFGYVIAVIGPRTLWNTSVWWQSVLVWFLGAVVLHDLVLFPLYALADRTHTACLRAARSRREHRQPRVPAVNYLRVPVLASGLSFLLFFPGIVAQGSNTYLAATGQTQEPFLNRWLLAVAVIFALSAVAYAVHLGIAYRRPPRRRVAVHSAQAGHVGSAVTDAPRATR